MCQISIVLTSNQHLSAGFSRYLDAFCRFSAGQCLEMASNQRFFCRYSNRFCRFSAGCWSEMCQISIVLASIRHLSAGFSRYSDVFCRFSAGHWLETASNQRFFCRYSNRFCRFSAGCWSEMCQISIVLASIRHLSAGFSRYSDVFCRFSAGHWLETASNQRFFCRYSNRFCRFSAGCWSEMRRISIFSIDFCFRHLCRVLISVLFCACISLKNSNC